jgi:hypothetical protein
VNAAAGAIDVDSVPSLRVDDVVVVTFADAVHAAWQSEMFAVTADASVIVALCFVKVPFTARDTGSVLFMMRMTSPGAVRAAVAPLVIVFQRLAKVVPSFESLPFSKSR